ncbi:MAG: ribosomal RNA small subunit methyltransferase E [Nitrospinaceae bacterium]|nr:MAG: ribosomal RNA small subunit methyltransferase E [Nitrospinaceae bacterium]
MHRFFVRPENISGDEVILRGNDVSHIRTVLRLKSGDRIQVLDGLGTRYFVQLNGVETREVRGRVESKEPFQTESPVAIQMGMALLKGNKFDVVLRKAVELGAHSIAPLQTDRCIVKMDRTEPQKKTVRWQRIAEEAAKQSGRSHLPKVSLDILSVESFCQENRNADVKLIFWEEEETHRLADLLPSPSPRSIAFLTGPEGGLTDSEIQTARQYGFQSITLGPRVLKAETAPVVVLSLLQSRWGDL